MGENEGAATAAQGGAAGFRPSTNDELEKRVPFGDVQQLIDAVSGPDARTPSVVGLAGIWSELRMLRVALVERNQLLAESNDMARDRREKARLTDDLATALGAYERSLAMEKEATGPSLDHLLDVGDDLARDVANALLRGVNGGLLK
jgi:hypothetical protein